MIKKRKEWREWPNFDGYRRIRCGCGCYPKDHYNGEGGCDKCGCTWYYPNDKFILAMRKAGFKKFSQVEEFRKWKRENNDESNTR